MRNLALRIEYDGSRFQGFQVQPGGVPTVQRTLEQALASLLGDDYVLRAACRTDTGVHALGQVVSVQTRNPIPAPRFLHVLNDRVGPYVRIHEAREVDLAFRPRYDAVLRHYRYVMCADPSAFSPLAYSYTAFVPPGVDWDLLERTAQKLVGYHDYTAFTTVPSEERILERSIEAIQLSRYEKCYHMDLYAQSFLRGRLADRGGDEAVPAPADRCAAGSRCEGPLDEARAAGRPLPDEGVLPGGSMADPALAREIVTRVTELVARKQSRRASARSLPRGAQLV
jgi:tRNA pseudouridine38-40 synthase